MVKILLVEDDVMIQELVTFNLEREGYTVETVDEGKSALEFLKKEKPDLILLDVMLSELDGFEVCKAIRANTETANLPIIMLSARDEIADKVVGLELGADDYITKPFSPRELLARIKARMREEKRNSVPEPVSLTWGDLEIWPESYLVTIRGEYVTLTGKEFELLHLFMKRPNQVFNREYLLQKVWGYTISGDTRTVDVHISNLRSKLKGVTPIIESVRGVGYRLAVSPTKTKNC
ncbi:response regulator transcription factor [Desulfitobacterium sp. THU1]|uniref:response regulator transcription factor n=1 Tax=Desulfitobacterium sp. THU1 TaxID=3138072 RepID=UPI00311ED277